MNGTRNRPRRIRIGIDTRKKPVICMLSIAISIPVLLSGQEHPRRCKR